MTTETVTGLTDVRRLAVRVLHDYRLRNGLTGYAIDSNRARDEDHMIAAFEALVAPTVARIASEARSSSSGEVEREALIGPIAAILLGNVNAPEQEIYRVARELAALPKPTTPERAKAMEEAALAKEVDRFASHAIGCALYQRSWACGEPPCTCGLDEVRAKIAALSASPPEVVESQD